jgi:hypothetical protein
MYEVEAVQAPTLISMTMHCSSIPTVAPSHMPVVLDHHHKTLGKQKGIAAELRSDWSAVQSSLLPSPDM